MNGFFLVCKEIAGEVPEEIQVIPHGYHETPKGNFLCDAESAAEILRHFGAQINDMVIDYEHQTLSGGEAPAAGWIKGLVDKGDDGIWATVEWTERARAYIKNKEYRYVSPVFLVRETDKRVVKLINVALVNQPNIDGMVPIVNKGAFETLSNKKEVTMKRLFTLLGLPEDASEDTAIAAVNKLKPTAQMVANKAVLDALGLKDGAGESEVVGTVIAMKQGHGQAQDLTTKITALEDRLKKRDAEELVALAMKDGKISAAQKDWATEYATRDAEGFNVFVSKAPVVVPMGELGNKGATGNKGADGLDEAQVQVNKQLGISAESFKKHNPKED